MAEFTFNPSFPQRVDNSVHFFDESFIKTLPFLKYIPIEKAKLYLPDWFLEFLDRFPDHPETHKHCLLDVKPQKLNIYECPALPKWHIDMIVRDMHRGRPERHYIYTQGLGCPTQFLSEPLTIDLPEDGRDFGALVHSTVERTRHPYEAIEEGRIYEYGRAHIHRAQPAKASGWRLLVRKTYSDQVRKGIIYVHRDGENIRVQ